MLLRSSKRIQEVLLPPEGEGPTSLLRPRKRARLSGRNERQEQLERQEQQQDQQQLHTPAASFNRDRRLPNQVRYKRRRSDPTVEQAQPERKEVRLTRSSVRALGGQALTKLPKVLEEVRKLYPQCDARICR